MLFVYDTPWYNPQAQLGQAFLWLLGSGRCEQTYLKKLTS
nr:hypothetical protein [uncultured bacterium]